MNQKYGTWLIAAFVLITGIGIFSYYQSKDNGMTEEKAEQNPAYDEKMMEGKAITDKPITDEAMAKFGSYQEYSPQAVNAEQAKGNKVVLFFYAAWCPYCRTADKAFTDNLDKIPTGVTVLKTDYDSNSDLKKKYGVTTQHTFVQIDDKQEKVTLWVSGDVELLKKNVK